MATEVAFDWDLENVRHLRRHRVTRQEFEELMGASPFYMDNESVDREERYKVLGATAAGRVLIAVWTPREGKVRAITAYAASRSQRQQYWKDRE